MNRLLAALVTVVAVLSGLFAWSIAGAQEDDTAEKGRFTRFVEDTISTPDRRISLGSIDGVLSSDVRIDRITISDRDGVWLTIEGAHLIWSRLALLRGRLDIDSLTADRISVTRPPLPATTADPAARPGFALPELPVSVRIGKLGVPVIALAQPVLGEPATLSVDGAVSLEGGMLDANVQIARTDDKPGKLALVAKFADDSRQLDLNLALEEPDNGVVATVLGLPGTPALAFTIAGSGPLSAFAADITLATAGEQRVTGRTTITEEADAYRFATDISAALTPLVAEAYRPYVAGTSTLALQGSYQADGSIRLDQAAIRSAVADLGVTGAFAADGFPTALTIRGALQDAGGPVPLPSGGKVDRAVLDVRFGGAQDDWTAVFDLTGLDTGTLRAATARIDAGGAAQNLRDPAARRVTFDVTGALRELSAADPNLARALGDGFDLAARGAWTAGSPVAVEIAEIKNPNAAVHFAGTIAGTTLDGRYWLNAADVAPFAGLAGRDIAGAVTLDSNGTVTPSTGAFALTITSEALDLKVDIPAADALLTGRTVLAGGAARSTEGLRFSDLRIENPNLTARIDGAYDLEAANLKLSATLADLRRLTDRATGPVSIAASLAGSGTAPAVIASLSADRLDLQGRILSRALARFDGRLEGADVDGRVTLSGALDGVPLDGSATVATADDGTRRLSDLVVTAGDNRLSGGLSARPDGLFDGAVLLDAPDIAVVAPLALVDAAGRITADVALAAAEGRQTATIKASARDLRIETSRIGTATIDARAGDLFGVPTVDGRFEATAITAGAVKVDRIQGTAGVRQGGGTDFDVAADLAAGTLATAGTLAAVQGGYDLTLARFQVTRAPNLTAALVDPVTVAVRGSTVTLPSTIVTVGSGRISLEGTVADRLDVSAVVDRLPLSLADAVAPDLRLGGTLSGKLAATGPRADLSATFDIRGEGLTAAPLRTAGLSPLAVTARGSYAAGTVRLTADTTVNGGRVRVDGTAGAALDLRATIAGLPLALANATQPSLGAQGTLDATATVTGTPAAPVADFTLSARNASVAATRDAGVPALALRADGRYEGDAVTLRSAALTAAGGLSLTASGRVPVAGGGADLAVRGSVPLALANRSLAGRGAKIAGTATLDARIAGALADPDVTGSVTVSGASFSDPETTTRLTGIDLRVALSGRRAVIERLSARANGAGTIGASGSIGLDPAAGFPVDVTVTLDRAKVTDGKIATAILGGTVSARGAATGALAVTGTINVLRAEITVPERLPSRATLLDVRHRLPPINVQKTLERARLATEAKSSGTGAATDGGVSLDITVDAPRAVFVRGRGIDAELGGRVRITGPVSAIQPVGSLTLIRGRLDVVGQRITFSSGEVTLVGDLDPYIDLVATTRSQTIVVTATVSGQASDPTLTLSSVPELPQDEVLAHFLFGRSLSDLSAFQIARLAVAAAELAGGGGGVDLLGQLRNAVGLDNLDVVTDSKGNAAVQAGRYIADNVYLGVTAGSNGQSNVSVNLDLTDNLKARAEVGPSSGGKIGVFYEREY